VTLAVSRALLVPDVELLQKLRPSPLLQKGGE